MGGILWSLNDICLGSDYLPRLEKITLDIEEGRTAIVGPSGAGKTSLLNILVGFEQPDRGTVCRTFADTGHTLPLFWAPQGQGLWPHLRVREHLEIMAAPGKETQEKARNLLSAFDIEDKAEAYPDYLSEGQRARLAVARALMSNTAVLVMDEPFASVDIVRMGKYWDVIRNHLADTKASLVFATHSPGTVLGEADRVVCLKEGRLLYSGHVDDLYWRPATPELANCLGEGNWLKPEEARLWLNREEKSPRCYRPEQVSVVRARESPFVVRSSRFMGSVAEVELAREETGEVRRFFHRPSSDSLCPGERVLLRVIFIFLIFLSLLTGCNGSDEPTIPVKEVRYWGIVPDGARVPAPRSVAAGKNDEVIVLDTAGRVLVYDEKGVLRNQWKMPETEAGNPEGVCVLKDRTVAIADTHYSRVIIFDEEGNIIRKFGRYGTGPGEFIYPVALTQDDREKVYVCEYGSNDRVQKFAPDGTFISSFGSFGTRPGQFQRPSGMVWRNGKIYIADAINNRIQVFSEEGEFIGILGSKDRPLLLNFPYDIAIGPDGDMYVVEYGAGRVSKISLEGQLLGRYGSSGAGEGQFNTPWGVAIDSKSRLRIADTGNRRIVELKQ